MNINHLRESIVRQVLLLLVVSLLSIVSLLMVHEDMHGRTASIRSLSDNEQVKVELGYLLHEKLQAVKGYFQGMALVRTEAKLQSLTLEINTALASIEDILLVLEHGGEVPNRQFTHCAEVEGTTYDLIYNNNKDTHINSVVLELRAILVEIQPFVAVFWNMLAVVMQQDIPENGPGVQRGVNSHETLVDAYSKMDPLFDELYTISNIIYFDAYSEMHRLEEQTLGLESRFHQRSLLIYALIGSVILILGWIVLRNIGVMLFERTTTQDALRLSNENLENQVLERTEELRSEVEVRHQAEIEQRRQVDFLKVVLDSLDHPFYVLDAETYDIQIMNNAALNREPDGMSFCCALNHEKTEHCAAEEGSCPVEVIKRTGKPVTIEQVHYDNAGQKHYVEVHGYPIFDADGVLRQVIEYSHDITAKKTTEIALEETNKNLEEIVRLRTSRLEEEVRQREKLQLVVEQNPSTIVITDLKGNIEYVNKQFEQVTGYSKEEALGQNPKILNSGLTPPETYTDMWATLEKGEIWTGEFINVAKNGVNYHENVLLAPLKDSKGVITHYVAIKENVTELKQAREAAEASNIAKSQFLSRMSHELRTPLHAINGFSQLLLKSNKRNPLDERQIDQVLQINTAGLHLLDLINEILDLSRIESGGMTLSLEAISVAAAIDDCLSLVGSLADKSGITLELDQSINGVPHIHADLTRLKQVLLNLLSNAIKYNCHGGTVTLTARKEGDFVYIEVADSGIGISDEQMKDLFVPFARLGQDDSGVEGTGIGMTISKQLVELMHGTLEAKSEPGVGTVFCMKLPIAKEAARLNTSRSADVGDTTEGVTEQKATFLYIEDNPSNIQLMKFIIEQWPMHSLVVRKNAEKGIKAAAMLKPDIIFMDLHLPGMTGQEAFVELQKNPATKEIPVIALSADALPITIEACLELGFVSYLTKPIEIESLRVEIEKCLQG